MHATPLRVGRLQRTGPRFFRHDLINAEMIRFIEGGHWRTAGVSLCVACPDGVRMLDLLAAFCLGIREAHDDRSLCVKIGASLKQVREPAFIPVA